MTRNNEKAVRRMLGIGTDREKAIPLKVVIAVNRAETFIARVSRQSEFGRECLVAILTATGVTSQSDLIPPGSKTDRPATPAQLEHARQERAAEEAEEH